MARNTDWYWAALIIAAVVIWNLLQPTNITSDQTGSIAGSGVDPFDSSDYTPDALAILGGAI